MTAQQDRDEDDDQEPYDAWLDDPPGDYREPDGDDYESARWYAEEAEHFEKVHGGTGVCDCKPSPAARLRWLAADAWRRISNRRRAVRNWLTTASRQPVTVRLSRLEFTVRLAPERPCTACRGRGLLAVLSSKPDFPIPDGCNGANLCGCGSAISRLADTRRRMRQWDKEPPFLPVPLNRWPQQINRRR